MEKTNHETTSSNGQIWGTLEDLLLASAVIRHGTTSWDSIADELRRQINHKHSSFSPHNCKQKYVHLMRRFRLHGEERENSDEDLLRIVVADELRKRRVEELKRALHRHDRSIVSLELKVKRLEEEREKEQLQEGSDLRIKKPNGIASETGGKTDEPAERSLPEKFDSAEDRSFNESNSSSGNENAVGTSSEKGRKPEGNILAEPAGYIEPVKESGSGNMSTSRPAVLGESVSELKRESDVQSSASLLSKRRRRFRGLLPGCGSSWDSVQAEQFSPANKRINVNSQPLIRFMEIIRSHKHGSVFQRRLPSQETMKYENLIRQHMDLDTVQFKLDRGIYGNCHSKFYRDLLLVFTNAILFYRKSSAEHLAARELRKLLIHEIGRTGIRPDPDPIMTKPRSSTTSMVVCRSRISGATQAASNDADVNDDEKKGVTTTSANLRSSNGNNRKNNNMITKLENNSKIYNSKELSTTTTNTNVLLKKQGVANFLRRIKQNSPSSHQDDEEEEEKLVESINNARKKMRGSSNGNIHVKSNRNNKDADNINVVVSRTRRGEREAAATMRADGRPPKRKAAMISRTPESTGKGSGRDIGDHEKSKKKAKR